MYIRVLLLVVGYRNIVAIVVVTHDVVPVADQVAVAEASAERRMRVVRLQPLLALSFRHLRALDENVVGVGANLHRCR